MTDGTPLTLPSRDALVTMLDARARTSGNQERLKQACRTADQLLAYFSTTPSPSAGTLLHDQLQREIEANITAQSELIATRDALQIAVEQRDKAEAHLKVAVEALQPFADEAAVYDPPEGDDAYAAWGSDFLIGTLRRARAALSQVQEKDGPT